MAAAAAAAQRRCGRWPGSVRWASSSSSRPTGPRSDRLSAAVEAVHDRKLPPELRGRSNSVRYTLSLSDGIVLRLVCCFLLCSFHLFVLIFRLLKEFSIASYCFEIRSCFPIIHFFTADNKGVMQLIKGKLSIFFQVINISYCDFSTIFGLSGRQKVNYLHFIVD